MASRKDSDDLVKTVPPLPSRPDLSKATDVVTQAELIRQLEIFVQQVGAKIYQRDEVRDYAARARDDERDSKLDSTLYDLTQDMAVLRHESQQTRLDIGRQATTLTALLNRVGMLEKEARTLRERDDLLTKDVATLKAQLAQHLALLERDVATSSSPKSA